MQVEHETVTRRARLRDILQSGAEIALSIGWVVAFFLVFLGLLSVTFPKGTSLRRLASDRRVSAHVPERMTIDLQSEEADHELVAKLAYKRHKVKHKPADYLAWADSRTGMPLHNRHSVQTLNQSAATIAFDNTEMTLGENSLVVVKSFERDRAANVNRASLVVLDGELRGSVPGGDDSLVVEVIAGNDSRVRPTSKAGERSTFAVNVSDDGSSTVAVYEGSAEVTGSDGVMLVGANESVQVEASGRVSDAVERIPDVPALSPNFASRHFQYRDLPPRVRLQWLAVEDADGYDVAIATDEAMSDVVFQVRTTEPTVEHGNLQAGTYYWRVRSIRGSVRSADSDVGVVIVSRDTVGPMLNVTFPPAEVQESKVTIHGTVEPGTTLHVADETVDVSEDGRFESRVSLRRGLNVIVVEAMDEAGNTSYRSEVIQATY